MEKSIYCFDASLQACPPHERVHYGRVLQNLGAVYNRIENYNKAMWYHQESVAVYGEFVVCASEATKSLFMIIILLITSCFMCWFMT